MEITIGKHTYKTPDSHIINLMKYQKFGFCTDMNPLCVAHNIYIEMFDRGNITDVKITVYDYNSTKKILVGDAHYETDLKHPEKTIARVQLWFQGYIDRVSKHKCLCCGKRKRKVIKK